MNGVLSFDFALPSHPDSAPAFTSWVTQGQPLGETISQRFGTCQSFAIRKYFSSRMREKGVSALGLSGQTIALINCSPRLSLRPFRRLPK
jgi:hypothetical protein